jgi:hypothetical protein
MKRNYFDFYRFHWNLIFVIFLVILSIKFVFAALICTTKFAIVFFFIILKYICLHPISVFRSQEPKPMKNWPVNKLIGLSAQTDNFFFFLFGFHRCEKLIKNNIFQSFHIYDLLYNLIFMSLWI